MAPASLSAQMIEKVCSRMAQLKSDIAGLERRPKLHASEEISELLHSGDAVLERLRDPNSATATAAPGGSGEQGEVESLAAAVAAEAMIEDPNQKGKLGVNTALRYLGDLEDEIQKRVNMPPLEAPAFLRAHVQPYPHQLRAAALGLHAEDSKFKGMILADAPGLGKTLSTLITIEAGRRVGDGPTLLIVPPSCTRQWIGEIRTNLAQGTEGVLLLQDANISPFDLFRYRIIVTSYGQVVGEYRRLVKFEQSMQEYEDGQNVVAPKRPKLTLLSGIWEMDGVQLLGRYLVLDEAHAIKNTASRAYAAIKALRERFKCCLMLSGTPLDNTWADIFSLLSLLRGHPFMSMLRMRETFTNAYDKKQKNVKLCVPRTKWLQRLTRLLHAVMTARPPATIRRTLPAFQYGVIRFNLPADELLLSNDAFEEYKKTMGANADPSYGKEKRESRVKWSALIKAQQYAFHPALVQIMEVERKAFKHNLQAENNMDDVQLSPEEQKLYDEWREDLKIGQTSRSARVDCIIDLINRHRDCRPDDGILILDESVYFLDILAVALEHAMYDPIPVFRYDGRQGPAERYLTMESFRAVTQGTRVMLASRGTGGQGLNVQCANVVIRCGPWWKKSWELQAEMRVYRPGQGKPVFSYEIAARKCDVEAYKRKVSGNKNMTNEKIMKEVTLDDAQAPPVWVGR